MVILINLLPEILNIYMNLVFHNINILQSKRIGAMLLFFYKCRKNRRGIFITLTKHYKYF